jgi:predicted DNA-binding transcriptional regulator YafY
MHRSNFDPNDPIHDPKSDPNALGERTALNHRQIWFLHQLNAGRRIRVGELRREHNVSEKTAKRDIAGLRQLNMIRYVGSRRRGEYMSLPMEVPSGKAGH